MMIEIIWLIIIFKALKSQPQFNNKMKGILKKPVSDLEENKEHKSVTFTDDTVYHSNSQLRSRKYYQN